MISLTMDMVQYDCPFIDTTDEHDVSFSAVHWDFDTSRKELETRMIVRGGDREALDIGLDALWDHNNMHRYRLLSKKEDIAVVKTVIAQTNAMKVIRQNNGYITGQFEIRDGSEIWHVGFDTKEIKDEALSELDRRNDFKIESRETFTPEDLFDLIHNAEAAKGLIQGCRNLSPVERETIRTAMRKGYFENP
ncbi:MAG: helix-turn-helix domain-containing protein, partial [Halobacteria archaeon]|nr:helix-turn-helix domain-containing protein [Halobacteria archaeon]